MSGQRRLWTVRDVLGWTTERFTEEGLESPRLDAEVLLAHSLQVERMGLYLDMDRPLDPAERGRYRELVLRRLDRAPVAYLVGQREFWSRAFAVDSRVLVPRPDTEILVERALKLIEQVRAPRVLDVGTGSGIIAVTLAAERPDAEVLGVDISADALDVAAANARRHGADVRFLAGDLLDALDAGEPPFHLVVANLPYIPQKDRAGLAPELAAEPPGALFVEGDGLGIISRLVRAAPRWLAHPDGALALEVGQGQAEAVRALLVEAGISEGVSIHRDLAGVERVVSGRLALG